ncbi:inhibitor of growth protein 3 isoform X2 [Copidosoma floridanum]|uniref:inhibitor of growth protein 3 isoform X2 n=1 Tax=Copidosoma floridanum TaxID=29053 RepID=UPI000C6FBFFB|nr:inhibitor of growth protein 3 isoform X2 [Copidosoma floridanum]
MLYLEDYIELIETLPQRLRDRFTDMREQDLCVQNGVDDIDKRINTFFANAKKMKANERENEHQAIMKQFDLTLKCADEKVSFANEMSELVKQYLKKLDQDIATFKKELEDDNKGITDLLEKRSLELDQKSINSSQKENRYSLSSSRSRDNHSHSRGEKRRDSNASSTSAEKRQMLDKVPSAPVTSNVNNVQDTRPNSANSGQLMGQSVVMASGTTTPSTSLANSVGSVGYTLGHIGAGGNAIAAAASQAIAATQHMQQGRRTASLKASYEAINTGGVHAAEFSRELAGAAQTAIAAIQESSKKKKKKVSSAVPNANVMTQQQVQQPAAAAAAASMDQVSVVADTDWPVDPNEPRYCICNQVSYGDMVACDNTNCPYEWFHYPCVNITAPPEGEWFCPQCAPLMKRKSNRKN